MWFADEDHKNLFYSFREKVSGSFEMYDRYYDSALYVLSFLESQDSKGLDRYINRLSINFPKIRKEVDFSTGQLALVNLAANCFNSNNKADVSDVFDCLSGNYKIMALEAIKHRYF